VVQGIVDHVNTDSVDAQLLELRNITLADGGFGERIFVGGGTTGLIIDAADIESIFAGPESCPTSYLLTTCLLEMQK